MNLLTDIIDELAGSLDKSELQRIEIMVRHIAKHFALETHQLKELIMSVSAQVQALADAIAAQTAAIADATAELSTVEKHAGDLEAQVADLSGKLTAALANAPVGGLTDDDVAALSDLAAKVTGSVATLKAAMPQPVAPSAVQAASDAAAVASPAPGPDASAQPAPVDPAPVAAPASGPDAQAHTVS